MPDFVSMSDFPTPPPLTPGGPPSSLPPPAPPGSARPYPQRTPPAPLARTAGLRKASVILFSCATASFVFVALAAWRRKLVFDGAFFDNEYTVEDLDNADALIGGAFLLLVVLVLASAIVVSIWSLHTTGNAKRKGHMLVSPGLACGGWYIPVGWLFVPFIQLRKVVTGSSAPITTWQLAFVGLWLSYVAFRAFGQFDVTGDAVDDVSSALTAQLVTSAIAAVFAAAATVAAARAMRAVDSAGGG